MNHKHNPTPSALSSEESTSDAQAFLDAGVVASQTGDAQRALDLFVKASAALPSWGLPHFMIGSEHAAAGRMAQAEAEFANAVLLAPLLHLARYQLGLLQFSSGRAAM